jgi:hypothetical protein
MSHSNPIVLDIINIVHQLNLLGKSVIFVWIPAHCGVSGNETVDKYAKQSCFLPNIMHISFNINEMSTFIGHYLQEIWINDYIANPKGKFYKDLFPSMPVKNLLFYSSRLKDVTLARLRFGHCRLNYHLNLIGCHDTGFCSNCNVPETVFHFLLECVLYEPYRQILISAVNKLNLKFDIFTLLTNPSISDSLYKFIMQTKRQI